MRKSTSLALILSAAMALTTVAVAAPMGQDHAGGWHGHHGHNDMMSLHKLNLTDAQRANVKQIMKTSFTQNKTQRDALRQQRAAFDSMTPNQVGYQAAASSLAQAEGNAAQLRVQQRANIKAQIYALLTPAQQAQWATMQTQRQTRMQQWKQFKAQQAASSSTGQ